MISTSRSRRHHRRSASSLGSSAQHVQDRPGAFDLRPRTTRSCQRSFERPQRSWWRSCRRAAHKLPPMVRMDRVLALRAHVASGGAAVAMRGALGCCAYLNECALLRLLVVVLVFADVHALELSHAESVPGTCVDWAGTLSAHQSVHVSVGACVPSCCHDASMCTF